MAIAQTVCDAGFDALLNIVVEYCEWSTSLLRRKTDFCPANILGAQSLRAKSMSRPRQSTVELQKENPARSAI
jgi:hypothetical protein